MAKEKKQKPYVSKDKCTGCGTCVQICPMQVFAIEKNKSVVKKPDECIACKACEMQCPNEAIVIK